MRHAATALGLALVLATAVWAEKGAVPERSGPIAIARIDGSINPASSDYLQRAIEEAATFMKCSGLED